jgi:hypothetical protein
VLYGDFKIPLGLNDIDGFNVFTDGEITTFANLVFDDSLRIPLVCEPLILSEFASIILLISERIVL